MQRVPIGGGAVITLVTGLTSPTAMAVDATSVYVADSGCPVDGSGCTGGAIIKVTPK